jgi:hypothetical protein
VIRLSVSAQRAIIRPVTENHENQTVYILLRGKTPSFLQLNIYVIVKKKSLPLLISFFLGPNKGGDSSIIVKAKYLYWPTLLNCMRMG